MLLRLHSIRWNVSILTFEWHPQASAESWKNLQKWPSTAPSCKGPEERHDMPKAEKNQDFCFLGHFKVTTNWWHSGYQMEADVELSFSSRAWSTCPRVDFLPLFTTRSAQNLRGKRWGKLWFPSEGICFGAIGMEAGKKNSPTLAIRFLFLGNDRIEDLHT